LHRGLALMGIFDRGVSHADFRGPQRACGHDASHRCRSIRQIVLRWRDRELSNRFSQAVVALVRQAHPNDLAD